MAETIDAHHHLWRYIPADYPWISDEMKLLQRDYLSPDLELAARSAQVDGSVVVQARQTVEETRWLLECAADSPIVQGVVGWLPLADAGLPALLHEFRDVPNLKGLRHVIQDEPDDNFILGREFNRGLSLLSDTDLVFDILIREFHLPQTIEFVSRHPHQTFVLDHLGKPRIYAGEMQPWKDNLKRLADFRNVVCKCSGLVTEANRNDWSTDDLYPYLDAALEAFGADRLMAGSDWPVCLMATGYGDWWSLLRQWSRRLSESHSAQFFGGTARRIYRLKGNATSARP